MGMDNREDDVAQEAGKEHDNGQSVEEIFDSKKVPSWQEQLTLRSLFVSFILGVFFSFIVMKLNLTTGIIPSLNVSAGLLGFFFVKIWTTLLHKSGLLRQPFTRQENTVIQTCVVACYGIGFSGGFGSYILAMSQKVASQAGEGDTPINIKDPSLHWLIGFAFTVSFVGLFCIVTLRKVMIIKYRLTYPSGTATAHLINSFHTPAGAKLAKKQVHALFRTFGGSFCWAFFQWFFTAADGCGFSSFPTFGLKAYKQKFYFDFSATYVGVGMICPYMINISLLLGSIISWGIIWPLIEQKKGDWYSATLSSGSLHGLQGYKVFITIATILGDGLYHFVAVVAKSLLDMSKQLSSNETNVRPLGGQDSPDKAALSYDDRRRAEMFLKDQIPTSIAVGGYIILAIISIITVPHIFIQLKWYHVLVTYLLAPVLAFCNSYGCGLTDWSLAASYGKLAIFIFGAWVGMSHGGVLAGLAACGVMMSIVSTASDLMQDFKTGYLTLASPRSMFVSQVIGTAMGCVIAPCVFWIFYKAFPLADPGSAYPAPYAVVYRGIALLGVEGFSSLPKNCLTLCLIFFLSAMAMNLLRDILKWQRVKAYKFVPSAMAMAIPFYLGSYFAIDMCLGSLILFIWEKKNKKQAEAFAPAVASGMICGDGIWSLPSSVLALLKVQPPICMKFLSASDNARADVFLSG